MWGSGFRVQGLGFKIFVPPFRQGQRTSSRNVPERKFRVSGFRFRVEGLGLRLPGLGFRG